MTTLAQKISCHQISKEMSAWTVVNDLSHQWATWTVYENGIRQGCFYHEHEAREWIKRHEFFKTRGTA